MDTVREPQARASDADRVWAALAEVIDPEVGIDVVNLGLVYDVRAEGGRVQVRMTMTTPACPLGPYMREEAEAAIRGTCPEVEVVEVWIVLDPPWSPERMTDDARKQLGWPARPSQ